MTLISCVYFLVFVRLLFVLDILLVIILLGLFCCASGVDVVCLLGFVSLLE